MQKHAAPEWARRWESLSPEARQRIAESMEPGQLRTTGLLGAGEFNNAWNVAGRLPTGQAGEFVRKLPTAGGDAMQRMYPDMMESSRILAERSPGGVAQYRHFDPDKGIYQDRARGTKLTGTGNLDSEEHNMLVKNYPGFGTPDGDLRDLHRNNLVMQEGKPMIFDWLHTLPGGRNVGENPNMPIVPAAELPHMKQQFGSAVPNTVDPQMTEAYHNKLRKGFMPSFASRMALSERMKAEGGKADMQLADRMMGTPKQRADAAAHYYLGGGKQDEEMRQLQQRQNEALRQMKTEPSIPSQPGTAPLGPKPPPPTVAPAAGTTINSKPPVVKPPVPAAGASPFKKFFSMFKRGSHRKEAHVRTHYSNVPLVAGFVGALRKEGQSDANILRYVKKACEDFPELRDDFEKAGLLDHVVGAANHALNEHPLGQAAQMLPVVGSVAAPVAGAVGAAHSLNQGKPWQAAGNLASGAIGAIPGGGLAAQAGKVLGSTAMSVAGQHMQDKQDMAKMAPPQS